MSILIDLLKSIALVAFLAAVVHYLFTQGLPPRGKGRWRNALRDLDGKRESHK